MKASGQGVRGRGEGFWNIYSDGKKYDGERKGFDVSRWSQSEVVRKMMENK